MSKTTIPLGTGVTGTLGVSNGGTGLASGTTNQFLKFTGSTTLASAADNAVFVQTGKSTSTTAVTAATIDNCFSTSYNNYLIMVEYMLPAGDNAEMRMRFRDGSSDETDTDYRYQFRTHRREAGNTNIVSAETSGNKDHAALTHEIKDDTINRGAHGNFFVSMPRTISSNPSHTYMWGGGGYLNTNETAAVEMFNGCLVSPETDEYEGIKFFFDSSNVQNHLIVVYGITVT